MKSHVVLALLWLVYVILHSVLASIGFKARLRSILGNSFRYYRLFYTLFAFAGLILIIVYMWRMENIELFTPPLLLKIAGALIMLSGSLLMLHCISKYFFTLSGLKTLMVEMETDQLMISGIHRYMRHPLYLGTFAFIWGGFLLLPLASVLIANTIITIYTLIGIRLEEEKLILEFGDSYKNYRKNVPALLPKWKKFQ